VHIASGELAIDDSHLASAQFMQMCQSTLFQPFIFQAAPAPSSEQVAHVVDSAMRLFLLAYKKNA
jgi:hypothetical protein